MAQLHKSFSDEQIAFLFDAYSKGLMSRDEIHDTLKIGKTRFFALWKQYKTDPGSFALTYDRSQSQTDLAASGSSHRA